MKAERRKVKFIKPNESRLGRFFKVVFGIELNRKKYDGFFHLVGYSGKQKDGNSDIVIVEGIDGRVTTIPNDKKYYKFI